MVRPLSEFIAEVRAEVERGDHRSGLTGPRDSYIRTVAELRHADAKRKANRLSRTAPGEVILFTELRDGFVCDRIAA